MAKWTPVSSEEEAAICEALEAGKSQYQVAKDFSRGSSTISRIATKHGLGHSDPKTKPAIEARMCYGSEARIKLVNRGLDKASDLLDAIDTPRALKDWFLGVAIGIDKRRLEDEDTNEGRGGELRLIFDKMGGGR